MSEPCADAVPQDGATPADGPHECCICYEAFASTADRDDLTDLLRQNGLWDDALKCGAGHLVCCRCIRKLLEPRQRRRYTSPFGEQDTGLAYRCPMCRSTARLNTMQALVLLKNSWREAANSFDGPAESRVASMIDWTRALCDDEV